MQYRLNLLLSIVLGLALLLPVSSLPAMAQQFSETGASLSQLPQAASVACPVRSTFNAGAEGWTVTGTEVGVTWQASGGNPGGWLSSSDDASGETWYWVAPVSFLGNVSCAYGNLLTFDLKQNRTDSQFVDADVILEGAGLTIVIHTYYTPGTSWTGYSVLLRRDAGWHKDDLNGQYATEAELRAVLGNLTSLKIRGEYREGDDTGGLDNVVLGNAGATAVSVVPGTAVIFLAGRNDVTIPPLGGDLTGFPLQRNCVEAPCDEYLLETFPLRFMVLGGQTLTFTARGGMDYYGLDQPSVGPDGTPDTESQIESLAGISGFLGGPHGALVGVFLDNTNPQGQTPPPELDFSAAGLGTAFQSLSPGLRQVFFIGDGLTGTGSGRRQTFTAPAGATRLFLGIADSFNFWGPPGAYDDNKGAFYVEIGGLLQPRAYLPLITKRR